MVDKRTDPIRALGADCGGLVLRELSVFELARCEQVDRNWMAFTREWMVANGLRIHFTESWRKTAKEDLDVWSKLRLFKQCAYEPLSFENLMAGRPSAVREYEVHDEMYVAREFTVWIQMQNGKLGLFWQRSGFDHDGSFYPVLQVSTTTDLRNVENLLLSDEGYVFLVETAPPNVVSVERTLHWISLHTGKEVWAKRDRIDLRGSYPSSSTIGFADEGIYRFGKEGTSIRLYDYDTGRVVSETILSGIPDGVRLKQFHYGIPISGYKLLVALDSVQYDANLYIIDPGLGDCTQIIPVFVYDDPFITVMEGENKESIFALTSAMKGDDIWVYKIQKFAADADGQFHECGLEVFSNGKYFPGDVEVDPFRHFSTGLHGPYDSPAVAWSRPIKKGPWSGGFYELIWNLDPPMRKAKWFGDEGGKRSQPIHYTVREGEDRWQLFRDTALSPPRKFESVRLVGDHRVIVTCKPPRPGWAKSCFILDYGFRQRQAGEMRCVEMKKVNMGG